MREVSVAEVVTLLHRAVEEKGADYVYKRPIGGCRNFNDDGTPSCIVGHVYHYLGIEIPFNYSLNWNGHFSVAEGLDNFTFQTPGNALLATVQDHQDDGVPWGEVVKETLETFQL